MRKYVIGGIFGVMLAMAGTAYADDIQSMIGRTIQAETTVYLDGAKIDTAIIIDGKSYVPTRSLSEADGKTVFYNEGGIYLETPKEVTPIVKPEPSTTVTEETYGTTEPTTNTPPTSAPTTNTTDTTQVPVRVDNTDKIAKVQMRIEAIQAALNTDIQNIQLTDDPVVRNAIQKDMDYLEELLAKVKAEKAALEAQQ